MDTMARVDDYQQARDLAARALGQQPLEDIAQRSGLRQGDGVGLLVPFLGKTYRIDYPDFHFTSVEEPEVKVPLQEQVLILHYLQGSRPFLKNQWIAYREIPGAGFYFGPFVKRAVDPLKKVFGNNSTGFAAAAVRLGGVAQETGDAAYCFSPLPYVPLQLIVWVGDDEFPAEANILFDGTAGDYLSPEDAAWLASLLVYRLISLVR
jgi:hypothetical protein